MLSTGRPSCTTAVSMAAYAAGHPSAVSSPFVGTGGQTNSMAAPDVGLGGADTTVPTGVGDAFKVGDGPGVAHPARRAQSRAIANAFMSNWTVHMLHWLRKDPIQWCRPRVMRRPERHAALSRRAGKQLDPLGSARAGL